MHGEPLSSIFDLRRRYTRSVNLERDLNAVEAVRGYVPTSRSVEALERVLTALQTPDLNRAFTFTGVYGTGKSSAAHFLISLVADEDAAVRHEALSIAKSHLGAKHPLVTLAKRVPSRGFVRAVVTSQREPLSRTILRALERGAEQFWTIGRKPHVLERLQTALNKDEIPQGEVVRLVQEVAKAAGTGVILVLDEMGKTLEFIVSHPGSEDLYLLQQLAELPTDGKSPTIAVIGILHQAFAEYGHSLAAAHRAEWGKVQGRFEDIPFTEATEQTLRLIGAAIECSGDQSVSATIDAWAISWSSALERDVPNSGLTKELIASTAPLHPITAVALPVLSSRFAQNDRSVFTFLTSPEPFSFRRFLDDSEYDGKVPPYPLDRLYDYFSNSVGVGMASRPLLQRWVEIQGKVEELSNLPADQFRAVKAIALLNLLASTGTFRAKKNLVVLALLDVPDDKAAFKAAARTVEDLLSAKVVTYRKQADELRLWEGSDFDIETAVYQNLEAEREDIGAGLQELVPLRPLVAQRHSYETGTLRFFERRYVDDPKVLANLSTEHKDSDGLIVHWVGANVPKVLPKSIADDKPLILLVPKHIERLHGAYQEYAALRRVQKESPQLQTDGVARREVRERLLHARTVLNDIVSQVFGRRLEDCAVYVNAQQLTIDSSRALNKLVSELCDQTYAKGLELRNELLNRRELTSQGAKARRLLIEHLLDDGSKERLGIEGYGPEYSMYASAVRETGIHVKADYGHRVQAPTAKGVRHVWSAIDTFCRSSSGGMRTVAELYDQLARPPYGVKEGPLPVLLAVYLLVNGEEVSVFKDGTLLPVLGAEHFELLVKHPAKFSFKFLGVDKERSALFQALADILIAEDQRPKDKPLTVMSLVRPLVLFGARLPDFSKQTRQLSKVAKEVRALILESNDPEHLLFFSLPQACGEEPFPAGKKPKPQQIESYRDKLVTCLRELSGLYPNLRTACLEELSKCFRISPASLRQALKPRAAALVDQCTDRELQKLLIALANDVADENEWLDAVLMIIGDKPAPAWTDDDRKTFEQRARKLARQFIGLESLASQATLPVTSKSTPRHLTLLQPGGQELSNVIWLNQEDSDDVKSVAESLLKDIQKRTKGRDSMEFQKAVVVALIERIFASFMVDDEKVEKA